VLGKQLPIMLARIMALAGMQAKRSNLADQQSSRPLEVRITEPLQWKTDCLQISIDRVNRSSNPLFLPAMGLYIDSSAIRAASVSGKLEGLAWGSIYGGHEIIDLSATPLAPDQTVHDDRCLRSTFTITNMKKETRRQVPVRGKLRIHAYYFLSEQDWLTNKSQHEEMLRTPPSKWPKPLKLLNPKEATAIVPIPCRESPCDPNCDSPPIILDGEAQVFPDAATYEREWNERGNTINRELAQTLSPCAAP
jgi:hypothetical protein